MCCGLSPSHRLETVEIATTNTAKNAALILAYLKQDQKEGDAIKYLVAVVLSALLIGHMHAKPPVHIKNQGKPTIKVAVADKSLVQPQYIERTTQKPPQASPTGVQLNKVTETTYAHGCSAYDSMFRQYDWNVRAAEAICQAESAGNPLAISATCDRGLMQINCIHGDMVGNDLSRLYNPSTNILVAYRIYSANGWGAWSTFNSGSYLKFL